MNINKEKHLKVIYFGDNPVKIDNDKVYTLSSLDMNYWEKYIDLFGSFTAVLRERKSDNPVDEKNLIKYPVCVKTIPSIAYPIERIKNYHYVKKYVKNSLKTNDIAIIKVPTFIGLCAIKEANKMHIPYFIEVGECIYDSLMAEKDLLKAIIAPYLYFKHRISLRKTKYGIYVTNSYLQKRYPLKKEGHYASCSNVVLESIQDFTEDLRIKRIEKMSLNKISIGTIGNMTNKLKGLDILFKCFNAMDYEVEIHILGKYDLKLWEKYIGANKKVHIYFDGFESDKNKVFEWLDNMDIYIHPSRAEGLPRAVIEAMSRGCPIIGSDLPGIKELINPLFCFRKGNYKSLINVFQRMIVSKEILFTESKNNFTRSKKYLKSNINHTRLQFFNDFIDENGFKDYKINLIKDERIE